MKACKFCREIHDPARTFVFDGFGVNGCDMYRNRIVTFHKYASEDQRKLYGPMFAAAPATAERLERATALLADLLAYEAEAFDEDTELDACDLVEWFGLKRGQIKAFLNSANEAGKVEA